jgi:hypothetical protein
MQAQNLREVKGATIANEMEVRRVQEDYYRVKSQSKPREYDVRLGEYGWICSCDDSYYRGSKCKHVWAVEFSFQLREAVKAIVPTVIYYEPEKVNKFRLDVDSDPMTMMNVPDWVWKEYWTKKMDLIDKSTVAFKEMLESIDKLSAAPGESKTKDPDHHRYGQRQHYQGYRHRKGCRNRSEGREQVANRDSERQPAPDS